MYFVDRRFSVIRVLNQGRPWLHRALLTCTGLGNRSGLPVIDKGFLDLSVYSCSKIQLPRNMHRILIIVYIVLLNEWNSMLQK